MTPWYTNNSLYFFWTLWLLWWKAAKWFPQRINVNTLRKAVGPYSVRYRTTVVPLSRSWKVNSVKWRKCVALEWVNVCFFVSSFCIFVFRRYIFDLESTLPFPKSNKWYTTNNKIYISILYFLERVYLIQRRKK